MTDQTAEIRAFDETHLRSEYKQIFAGSKIPAIESAWLTLATEEIYAHIRDRYELTLKPDKARLSFNEIIGIIARNLEDSRKPKEHKTKAYDGPINVGDRFHWDADEDEWAAIEVTSLDVTLGTVTTRLLAGNGPKAEVVNTEIRFRKHCTPIAK